MTTKNRKKYQRLRTQDADETKKRVKVSKSKKNMIKKSKKQNRK